MLGNGPVRFGGRPHGKGPAQRAPRRAAHPVPQFHPEYYAANVLDPDGYSLEICFKPWLYE